MSQPLNSALAKQYARYLEVEASARAQWDEKDRLVRKLVKLAKLGRKSQIVVPISENRGLRITDLVREFRKEGKLFAPAFARRFELKEVALEPEA